MHYYECPVVMNTTVLLSKISKHLHENDAIIHLILSTVPTIKCKQLLSLSHTRSDKPFHFQGGKRTQYLAILNSI